MYGVMLSCLPACVDIFNVVLRPLKSSAVIGMFPGMINSTDSPLSAPLFMQYIPPSRVDSRNVISW